MITITNTTRYQCDHCKKELKMEHAMVRHEKYCTHNPANHKACVACIYLRETSVYVGTASTCNGDYREAKSFECSVMKIGVYPTKAERLKLPEKYPETFKDQIPMPTICDKRKSFLDSILEPWEYPF